MRQSERGFALLTSHLGDPARKCLTVAQFRALAKRVRDAEPEAELRDLVPGDLTRLGYDPEMAERIVGLLEEEWRLDAYLSRAKLAGCGGITRVSEGYPQALRVRLGLDAPGCLWYKGDLSLLDGPMAALVGSRELLEKTGNSPEKPEFRQRGKGLLWFPAMPEERTRKPRMPVWKPAATSSVYWPMI